MSIAHPPDSWELRTGPDPRSAFHLAAQRYIDDEIIAAGMFMPNAVGRGELSSITGLRQRQLLKGRRAYLGERVGIAVTCLHMYVVPPMIAWPVVGPRYQGDIACFDRDDVGADPVPVAVPGLGRAFELYERSLDREIAELRMRVIDDAADTVLDLLLDAGSA